MRVVVIDIFFLFLLSIFLGARLWGLLGRRMGGSHRKRAELRILSKGQVVVERQPVENSDFYPGFSESAFLSGAETAFVEIVRARHASDWGALRKLVSPELLLLFEKAPPRRANLEKVCVLSSTITTRLLRKEVAHVAVQLSSQQVYDGKILTIDETWTFTRSIRTENPNWLLSDVEGESSLRT